MKHVLDINWRRGCPIIVTHIGALAFPFCYTTSGLFIFLILFSFTGIGVTVGLHRLLTHRSFGTYRWVERMLALFGALAFQGGILEWVALHRIHHQHSDTVNDPHTPKWKFLRGHCLWVFEKDSRISNHSERNTHIPDLYDDKFYRFLDGNPVLIQSGLAILLFGLGALTELSLGLSWLIYGVFLRIVALQHATWLVNSASHRWGYKSFSTRDESSNCWWVALLTFGEGWHNNHHADPTSANFRFRWFETDPGYWVISLLKALGLAWDVNQRIRRPGRCLQN